LKYVIQVQNCEKTRNLFMFFLLQLPCLVAWPNFSNKDFPKKLSLKNKRKENWLHFPREKFPNQPTWLASVNHASNKIDWNTLSTIIVREK
jgi:hypothetical protein